MVSARHGERSEPSHRNVTPTSHVTLIYCALHATMMVFVQSASDGDDRCLKISSADLRFR